MLQLWTTSMAKMTMSSIKCNRSNNTIIKGGKEYEAADDIALSHDDLFHFFDQCKDPL